MQPSLRHRIRWIWPPLCVVMLAALCFFLALPYSDDWYQSLEKVPFYPSDVFYFLAWGAGLLCCLIFCLCVQLAHANRRRDMLWVQLSTAAFLCALFFLFLFRLRMPGGAIFAAMLLLLIMIVAARRAYVQEGLFFLLLIPPIAWLGYVLVLQYALVMMN